MVVGTCAGVIAGGVSGLGGSESCAKSTEGGDSVHVRFVSFERADS